MVDVADAVKARKRTAVKPSNRQPSAKVKLTLYVSEETAQRLAVHATMTRSDRSALVESLIRDNCRRFVVSDRAKSADPVTVEESAA